MANILYGVNGEGSGHSTRAKEVIKHLLSKGHSVHVASFDRGLRNLSADFPVTEIYGMGFAYVENQVRYRKTVLKNLITLPQAAKGFRQLSRLAAEWNINLVCTDFEPLSYHVGHHRKVPVISIDNQHALTHARIEYPKEFRKKAAAAKLVTRLMIPHATEYLITTFFPAQLKRRRGVLVPPILRQEVLDSDPTDAGHVLVYVTSPLQALAAMLRRIREPFVCYGFNRGGVDGNLTFKKPSLPGFLADLASCKAVIANAGFSLISEALHFGKPYLAVPVRHQFEQTFNAYYLDKCGYGGYWQEPDKEKIESFLFNVEFYRENLARYPRQDNSRLFSKLDGLVAATV